MTREHKLALIVGFSLLLLVGVLISDHVSSSRRPPINQVASSEQSVTRTTIPAGVDPTRLVMGDQARSSSASPAAGGSATAQPPLVTPPNVGATLVSAPKPSESSMPTDMIANVTPAGVRSSVPAASEKRLGGTSDRIASEFGSLTEAVKTNGGKVVVDSSGNGTIHLPPVKDPIASKTAPRAIDSTPVRTHTVGKGDTLAGIASKYYGESGAWRKLAEFNSLKDGTVRLGQAIKVPSKDVLLGRAVAQGSTPSAPADASKASKTQPAEKPGVKGKPAPKAGEATPRIELATYTVRRGDTLGTIAQRTMGSAKKWRELAEFNKLDDEDAVSAGMVLKIPHTRG